MDTSRITIQLYCTDQHFSEIVLMEAPKLSMHSYVVHLYLASKQYVGEGNELLS